MLYIRLSVLRKTKNKDGALEKNVEYQFEFPRQCIVQKNALSLTQAPMKLFLKNDNYFFEMGRGTKTS